MVSAVNRLGLLAAAVVLVAGCGHGDDPSVIRLAPPDGATTAQRDAALQAVIARIGQSEVVEGSGEEIVVRLPEGGEPRAEVVRRMTAPGVLTLGVATEPAPVLDRGDFFAPPASGVDEHGHVVASLGFSSRGARRFAALMRHRGGERVPLWLAIDGRVVSRWMMKAPKAWDDEIMGLNDVVPMRTEEQAAQVAAFGRSGPLSVPLHVAG